MKRLQVACIQLCPGNVMPDNLAAARTGALQARAQGAELIAFPEFAAFLDRSGRTMAAHAAAEEDHPALAEFKALAAELSCRIVVGSLTVRDANETRLSNRSFVLGPQGQIEARYDKIHMFDAHLPGGRSVAESNAYRPGERAVVVKTPSATLGLSICYDLRFPQLFRALAQSGAELLLVPAAFAAETGPLHWQVLLQARAIETGCFVVAPATCGDHPGGFSTHGRSMIVDPMGRIVAQAGPAPEVLVAEIDLGLVGQTRAGLPSLSGDRPFDVTSAATLPPAFLHPL